MKKYAVIVAGGEGKRMKTDLPKQFLLLHGFPVLMHTINQFDEIDEIIVVLPSYQIVFWKKLCDKYKYSIPHIVVEGGKSRYQSVKNGLALVPSNCLVAIHDGVRPLVSKEIIANSFKIAKKRGSAIAVVVLKESIRKKIGDFTVSKNREDYFLVQTPQTFSSTLLKEAYDNVKYNLMFTDDASVFEALKKESITLIEGDYKNIKITTSEDLIMAQMLQKNSCI